MVSVFERVKSVYESTPHTPSIRCNPTQGSRTRWSSPSAAWGSNHTNHHLLPPTVHTAGSWIRAWTGIQLASSEPRLTSGRCHMGRRPGCWTNTHCRPVAFSTGAKRCQGLFRHSFCQLSLNICIWKAELPRKEETQRSSTHWFSPQMPQLELWVLHAGAGAQAPGSCFVAFPGALVRS